MGNKGLICFCLETLHLAISAEHQSRQGDMGTPSGCGVTLLLTQASRKLNNTGKFGPVQHRLGNREVRRGAAARSW